MNNKIDLFKGALRTAWGYNDYNDWPIKFNSIMHLFIKEFAQEFLVDYKAIRDSGLSHDQISRTFYNPARIFRIINPVIYGMKLLRIDLSHQRMVVYFMLDLVRQLKYGSEFNEDGRNIILSQEEVKTVVKMNGFTDATASSSDKIHKFCGIMWAYTEAIFFRAHDVTKEIHGAYDNNLIIREYLNLKPSSIWKNIPLLPFNSVKIYTQYSENLKISIDSYNHLFHEGGNFKNDLINYFIEIDNKQADVSELVALIPQMLTTISAIQEWSSNCQWQDLVKRYADIYWFRKKPFRDLNKKDWRVPQNVYKQIDIGSIDERRKNNLTQAQIEYLVSTII